jgi:hypothetical protein
MKRFFYLLVFVVSGLYAAAQDWEFKAPDYDAIKKEVADKSSSYYYPALMSRFVARDTTLTPDQYRDLYYGYVFQPGYKPYWISPVDKELNVFYKSDSISPSDYDTVLKLTAQSLEDFPFSLDDMNFQAYICSMKGDKAASEKIGKCFAGIIGTIFASGDGKSDSTAFHVISVHHEYVLLHLFRFAMSSQSLIQGKYGACDYLELRENEANVKGIYFNVNRLFTKQSELLDRKK